MLAQLAQLGFAIGGGILGNDAAEDAEEAARAAAALRVAGYEDAIRTRRSGSKRAVGYLSPYEQSGRAGQKLLDDALGINGPDAQRAYYSNFVNDPGFAAVQDAGIGTVEQSRAAGGGLRSGATMKALMDFGQRLQQSVFQDRLSRLANVGTMGVNTATNMARLTDSGSSDVANLQIGRSDAQAGGVIGASNARQAGSQNLIQMLGYGAGAIGGMGNDLFKSKLPSLNASSTGNPAVLGSFY